MQKENEISAEQPNDETVDVEFYEPEKNSSIQRFEYSGPLPPAAEMERYAKIDPTFADRIMTMAEVEAKHRHEMDSRVMAHQASDIKRGQRFALTIGLASFLFSGYALYLDKQWAAAIFGGSTLVLLVSAFIKGRKAN